MDTESSGNEQVDRIVEFTPFPLTLNHAWLTHGKRRFRTKSYLEFEKEVGKIVDGKILKKGRYKVSVVLYPNTRRKYDADNRIKVLLDSLTTAGVWEDDSLVNELHIYKGEVITDEATAVVSIDVLPKRRWFVPAKLFGFVKKIFKKDKEEEYDSDDEFDDEQSFWDDWRDGD